MDTDRRARRGPSRRLRFRRHLAACVLLVLAAELPLGARHLLSQRRDSQRPHRVRLAAAAATAAPARPHPHSELVSGGGAAANEPRSRLRRLAATQPHEPPELLERVYNYDFADENGGLLNELQALISSHIPVLDLNYTLWNERRGFITDQLDREVDDFYAEKFKPNSTLDDYQLVSVKAATRVAPLGLHTAWGYASRDQMAQGSEPVRDERLCRSQLARLARRLDAALARGATLQAAPIGGGGVETGVATPVDNFEARQVYLSTDLDFWRYLDTFGRVESDLLRGNIRWLGSYSGCMDTRLTPSAAEAARMLRSQRPHLATTTAAPAPAPTATKPDPWTQNRLRALAGAAELAAAAAATPAALDSLGTMRFRYCVAALRSRHWPPTDSAGGSDAAAGSRASGSGELTVGPIDYGNSDLAAREQAAHVNNFIRVGVCLPEACDSSAIEPLGGFESAAAAGGSRSAAALATPSSGRQSIERLLKFGLAKPFDSDHYYLSGLYCLPDNRSPLRQIPLLGKLLIVAAVGWLAIIGAATLVHLNVERFYARAVDQIRRKQARTKRRRSAAAAHAYDSAPNDGGDDDDDDDDDAIVRHRTRTKAAGDASPACSSASSASTTRVAAADSNSNNNANDDDGADDDMHESDVLQIRHYWIRLNVYVWDKARELVAGVDLIACLSLYSNWLHYTQRCKLAIARLYEREQAREAERLRNEELVRLARQRQQMRIGAPPPPLQQKRQRNQQTTKQPLAGAAVAADTKLASDAAAAADKPEAERPNEPKAPERRPVDTSSLNALKVVALVWIIAGHCVFYMGSVISNGAILKTYLKTVPSFALANGAMYITELFFVITGCLTSYLTFKHNSALVSLAAGARNSAELSGGGGDAASPTKSAESLQMRPLKGHGANKELRHGPIGGHLSVAISADKLGQSAAANQNQQRAAYGLVRLKTRLFSAPFWLLLIVHRYLRIMPTYALIYAAVKLVSVYVGGEGPLWDYAVSSDSMRLACATESWLPTLTLTSNFVDIYKHCIIGGWYLSTDMQFAIVSMPLLFVLALCQRASVARNRKLANEHLAAGERESFTKSQRQQESKLSIMTSSSKLAGPQANQVNNFAPLTPPTRTPTPNDNNQPSPQAKNKQQQLDDDDDDRVPSKGLVAVASMRLLRAYGLIFALGSLSGIFSMLYGLWQQQVDLSYALKFAPHSIAMLSRVVAIYTNSIFRFRAMAFGLILGHVLYMYEFRLIKLPNFIQRHGSKLMVVIFVLGFATMFAPVLYPRNKILISHEFTSVMAVLTAGAIDLFLCIMIFLICIKKAPKLVLFVLNSPFWSLFSTLSLSAFLIHAEVIILLSSQFYPPPATAYSVLLFLFGATIILTYVLALALYLSFELPVSRLIEALMKKYVLKMAGAGSGAAEVAEVAHKHRAASEAAAAAAAPESAPTSR